MKPLCIDLYAGLGGWSEGFLAEGWDCIGFDIERHDYGTSGYPGQLVLQDVLTLHGSQFRNVDCIVASPPCQKYSYMAQPWSRAKVEAAWQRWFRDSGSPFADSFTLNDLFNACFRIQREASAAAGRYIPMVVENVKGAQPWVGAARWHYGSYYLWGDVPALMPFTTHGIKVGGSGDAWFDKALDERRRQSTATKGFVVGLGRGHDWKQDPSAKYNSKSSARKAASAQIAKIPFELASYIARYITSPPLPRARLR